jgi:hypothetical protein
VRGGEWPWAFVRVGLRGSAGRVKETSLVGFDFSTFGKLGMGKVGAVFDTINLYAQAVSL